MSQELKDTLGDSLEFVSWYRRMVIEGQIQVSEFALERKPRLSDYNLAVRLRLCLSEQLEKESK